MNAPSALNSMMEGWQGRFQTLFSGVNTFQLQSAILDAAYRDVVSRLWSNPNWDGSSHRSDLHPADEMYMSPRDPSMGQFRPTNGTPVSSSTPYGPYHNPDVSRVIRQILADAGAPYVEPHPSTLNYGITPRRSYENPGQDRFGFPGFAHDGMSMTINQTAGSQYVPDPAMPISSDGRLRSNTIPKRVVDCFDPITPPNAVADSDDIQRLNAQFARMSEHEVCEHMRAVNEAYVAKTAERLRREAEMAGGSLPGNPLPQGTGQPLAQAAGNTLAQDSGNPSGMIDETRSKSTPSSSNPVAQATSNSVQVNDGNSVTQKQSSGTGNASTVSSQAPKGNDNKTQTKQAAPPPVGKTSAQARQPVNSVGSTTAANQVTAQQPSRDARQPAYVQPVDGNAQNVVGNVAMPQQHMSSANVGRAQGMPNIGNPVANSNPVVQPYGQRRIGGQRFFLWTQNSFQGLWIRSVEPEFDLSSLKSI